jgi:thioesterase domain-containing protein
LQPVFLVPFFKNLPLWLKSTRTIGRGQLLQRLKRKLRRRRSHHGQQSAADVLDYGGELSADRQHLIIENLTLLNAYKPEPFAGNILYVRAQTRSLLSPHDKLAGWQHLFTGQAMVCDIPGSHEGMFREPNVNLLAQQLRLHLR